MCKFYELYPIRAAVPHELSWSHIKELIRVDRKEERELIEFTKQSEMNELKL